MPMRQVAAHPEELTMERIATSLEQLCGIVDRLTVTVEMLVGTVVPPQPHEKQAGCTHPDDRRTNLSGPHGRGKFYCRDCGFRN
jgi:hypothetical protein